MAKMPTMDEWAERLGNKVINEYVYEGRTMKEWIDLMASGKLVILPNNATNGDVIKAIFPYAKTWEEKGDKPFEDVMRFDVAEDKTLECFDLEWWNEPYKAGDTDE